MHDPTVQFLIGAAIVFAIGLGVDWFADFRTRKLGED